MDDGLDTTVRAGGGLRKRNKEEVRENASVSATPIVKAISKLDAFPKVNEDYAAKSSSGAVVSIVCGLICLGLFISEVIWHTSVTTHSKLSVDTEAVLDSETGNSAKMAIHLDIVFPRVSCKLVTLDTTDLTGDSQMDVHNAHFAKRRLDSEGEYIDPLPTPDEVNKWTEEKKKKQETALAAQNTGGAPLFLDQHINNLLREEFPEGIDQAFRNPTKEGCEMQGYLEVNRVSGGFEISPGRTIPMGGGVHLQMNVGASVNLTHYIKRLAFGESFPNSMNPLDDTWRELPLDSIHQYFFKVVPTTFQPLKGEPLSTNQFSVTESSKVAERDHMWGMSNDKSPGVYFSYELSPIRVNYSQSTSTFTQFMTSMCAIIGGVFTMSGVVFRIAQSGSQAILKVPKGTQ